MKSAAEKVRETLRAYPAGLSTAELMERVPDVSREIVDATLSRMVETGEALRVTRGFYRIDPTAEPSAFAPSFTITSEKQRRQAIDLVERIAKLSLEGGDVENAYFEIVDEAQNIVRDLLP